MCNLYLMYYTLSEQDDFKLCFDEDVKGLSDKLPQGDCVLGEGKQCCGAATSLHSCGSGSPKSRIKGGRWLLSQKI